MPTEDPTSALVQTLRALGDESRLKVVALLARRPHYGEELAEVLQLKPGTISHHLRTLREAGLVQSRRESPYILYWLREESLGELLENFETPARLHERFELPSEEDVSRKVLKRLLDEEGRLLEIPSSRRPRVVALRWAAHHLDTGRLYPDRELRLALLTVHSDPDRLREELLRSGWLQRSGAVYRRVEEVDRT